MRFITRFMLFCILITMTAVTLAQDDTSAPPLRFVERTSLEVLDATLPRMQNAIISPDGSMIAWDDRAALCIYVIDTAQQDCTPHPEAPRIVPRNLYWSPDSAIIALEEDVFNLIIDGDLWLFDVENRTFVNRTDDNSEANLIGDEGEPEPLVDVLPTWDSNTVDLYFIRVRPRQDNFIGLYRINSGQGPNFLGLGDAESDVLGTSEPEMIIDLTGRAETIHFSIFNSQYSALGHAVAISPDGSRIAFLVRAPNRELASNGVWIVDLLTGNVDVISRRNFHTGAGLPNWMRNEMIEDGLAWADDNLVVTLTGVTSEGIHPVSYYVDTETGRTTPLLDYSAITTLEDYTDREESRGLVFTQYGMVTPDGGHFLYTSMDPTLRDVDVIWSIPLPPDPDDMPQALTPSVDAGDFNRFFVNRPSYGIDGNLLRVLMGGYMYTFEIVGDQ